MPSMGIRVPRVSRRTALGVVAVAAVGAGVAWGVAPSSAAPQPAATPKISFTGNGATPSSLSIRYGQKVVFENDVDPSANVPVLGTVTGALKSVTITVSGATQKPFTLAPGQQATVGPYFSGNQPVVVHYTSNYNSTMVAGLLPGPKATKAGTLTVAASPLSRAPVPGNVKVPTAASVTHK
jgi:hypothetical protein